MTFGIQELILAMQMMSSSYFTGARWKKEWDHLQYWNRLIILYPWEVPVEQFSKLYCVKLKWLLQFQQIIRKKIGIKKREEERKNSTKYRQFCVNSPSPVHCGRFHRITSAFALKTKGHCSKRTWITHLSKDCCSQMDFVPPLPFLYFSKKKTKKEKTVNSM